MKIASHLKLFLGGVALVLQAAKAAPPSINNSVVAVRFWSLADVTRVAVETTGEFEFKSDRVANPERLFFDFAGSRLALRGRGQHVIPVGDHLLKQIRVAETTPGTIRVVFDLETGVDYTASQLSNPNRLIVELRPQGTRQPGPLTSGVTQSRTLGESTLDPGTAIEPAAIVIKESARPAADKPSLPLKPASTDRSVVTAVPPLTPRTEPAVKQEAVKLESTKLETAKLEPVPTLPTPPEVAPKKPNPPKDAATDPTQTKKKLDQAIAAAPKPAKLSKNGDQSLTRVLGLKVGKIVIDAGHGGHDTGTSGANGLLEKDLVLDVAKRLGALVESRLGSEVIYTRTDDTFIPLEGRPQLANEKHADLFISIHANSSPSRSATGIETYYLNFTTDKTALEVAARENASSQTTVYELKDLLQKIALKDKLEESRQFAARVQSSLYSFSAKTNPRSRDRGVKKAPFIVLIGAEMPAVLAEIGFVSNAREEALMKKPDHRQKIAEALFKGLSGYASTLSHFQVAAAK